MNIYADRGNLLLLERRCAWRGIGFAVTRRRPRRGRSTPTRTTSSTSAAARTATSACARYDLVEHKRDALHAAAARGALVLGVCGGYQLLGHSYELGDERDPRRRARRPAHRPRGRPAPDRQRRDRGRPPRRERAAGAGRLREPRRAHRSSAPASSRSAACCSGHGNDGRQSGYEGVRRGSVIGTYLHGPLLPKNAWFADWLIATARRPRRRRLAPLDDALEDAAHASARRAAGLAS